MPPWGYLEAMLRQGNIPVIAEAPEIAHGGSLKSNRTHGVTKRPRSTAFPADPGSPVDSWKRPKSLMGDPSNATRLMGLQNAGPGRRAPFGDHLGRPLGRLGTTGSQLEFLKIPRELRGAPRNRHWLEENGNLDLWTGSRYAGTRSTGAEKSPGRPGPWRPLGDFGRPPGIPGKSLARALRKMPCSPWFLTIVCWQQTMLPAQIVEGGRGGTAALL